MADDEPRMTTEAPPADLSRQALMQIIEASHTAIVLSDPRLPDNPLVFANKAFRTLSGYGEAELIGRNCRFLQGPGTDPADVRAIAQAISERREIVREILNYRKDGTPFANRLHVRPIFDEHGELVHFLGSQIDLGEDRGDWRRFAASEERYRTLVDTIDAGFCVFEMKYDPGGRPIDYRFVEVNPAFEAQTGLSGVLGRCITEFAPDLEQRWFDLYGEVDRTRTPARAEEHAAALGRHFELHAYPTGRPDEHLVAVLFTDVTARRRAESDLRALNQNLETEVAERTRQLLEAGEALRQSQKMEAIGQLTGGVAHDFNNMLTIIRSAGEFLRKPDAPAEKRRRYIDAIVDTADRAAALTGQLLAFARRQPLRAEALDIDARIEAVAQLIAPMIGGGGIDVRIEKCPDGPCFGVADPGQFDTAIVNLAVNARDAMEGAGAMRLSVGKVDRIPAIRHHTARAGAFVAIAVSDTGSGIAPDALARIFEPFFTTKDVGKGTGLGLSQVFGFAKQSGGDIGVESSPAGTTFTLYIPSTVEGGETVATPLRRSAHRLPADACVLVVEDNPEVGRFSTELLHDLGLRTLWVDNGEKALAELASTPDAFDLVFSDVMMPGMNGVTLGREIRRLYPSVPVVLTSGYSAVLAEQGSYGMPLIRKPYSLDTLSDVLARALEDGG